MKWILFVSWFVWGTSSNTPVTITTATFSSYEACNRAAQAAYREILKHPGGSDYHKVRAWCVEDAK